MAPCVSPRGYQTINRWNPPAIDPNRSFRDDGQCMGMTEICPDSPKVDAESCNQAQVAAVTGALDYLLRVAN